MGLLFTDIHKVCEGRSCEGRSGDGDWVGLPTLEIPGDLEPEPRQSEVWEGKGPQ